MCIRQYIYTAYGQNVFNTGQFSQSVVQLRQNLLSTVSRCTFRQRNCNSTHALVFVRYKASRCSLSQSADADNHNHQAAQNQLRFADTFFNISYILTKCIGKPSVETCNHFADKAFRSFFITFFNQQQCAQCRSQGQRYNSRKHHGNRNGNSKLFIQLTYSTTSESNRNKYRTQYESNSHNRAGNFIHSAIGSFTRRHTIILNMMFNCFNNDNRIIDNKADSQNHSESSQRIDCKTKQYERSKSTNQRYRNCQQRNHCCTPAA